VRGIILKGKVDSNATVVVLNCSACIERLTDLVLRRVELPKLLQVVINGPKLAAAVVDTDRRLPSRTMFFEVLAVRCELYLPNGKRTVEDFSAK